MPRNRRTTYPSWYDPIQAYPQLTPEQAWARDQYYQAYAQRELQRGIANYQQAQRDAQAYENQRQHLHREAMARKYAQSTSRRRPRFINGNSQSSKRVPIKTNVQYGYGRRKLIYNDFTPPTFRKTIPKAPPKPHISFQSAAEYNERRRRHAQLYAAYMNMRAQRIFNKR
jgi:hypothetical protein